MTLALYIGEMAPITIVSFCHIDKICARKKHKGAKRVVLVIKTRIVPTKYLNEIATVQRRVKQTQYKINTHPHYCWPGCYYSCCYYPDLRRYRTLRQNVHYRRVHSHYPCLTRLTNLNPYHSRLQGRQLQLHRKKVEFLFYEYINQ